MEHVKVNSTHIHSIGHDGNEMHVTYKAKGGGPGPVFVHTPMTAEDHATIMKRIGDGESAGKIIRTLEPRGSLLKSKI